MSESTAESIRLPSGIVVVLFEPQDVVNIAGTIRAMKNMGLRRLRLVSPAEFDPYSIEGVAHRTADMIAATEIYDHLDAALADATYVVGTSARPRGARQMLARPRELAPELLARAEEGTVALLFGREDNGLPNWALDRCHRIVSIPSDPAYPSLNLAQSVLLLAYEVRMAAGAERQPFPLPRKAAPPATAEQLEELFGAIERALWAVGFFKAHLAEGMLRTLRSLVHRADPDRREAALLKAMCMETINVLEHQDVMSGHTPAGPASNP
ncbi:MAG: rRNA methyltransferase [Herpetosiphonaceae bacterium]|nr:MAG: rRNA methyltransferase [Herpetosiphonaceae bacterium]